MQRKKRLSEDDAFQIALRDHPDLRKAFENDTLPEEMTDEEGNAWNPRVHLQLHAVVERQIANDEPKGVAEIAGQLEHAGVDRHEIRHIIAQPLAEQMWYMMKEGSVFDEKLYLLQLEEALEQCR